MTIILKEINESFTFVLTEKKNGFSFPFTYLMHVSEHYRKAQVLKICIGANDIGTSFQATFPIPVWLIANS